MRIVLNGDATTIPDAFTISDLLASLGIDPLRVAVERNFVVVKRDRYAATILAEGDQVEIVNFVGGG